jgi:hypothetical protein
MNLSINSDRGFAVWAFIDVFHISSIAKLFRFVKLIHRTPSKIWFIKPIRYTCVISRDKAIVFAITIAQKPT